MLSICRASSVAESVWAGIVHRSMEGEIPEAARAELEDAHAGATARNALLLSEAAEAQAALARAGIESVVLKGPGLIVAHYPHIGARHVGDVDLLVRESDAARAEAAVRSAGARDPAPAVRYDGGAREPGERGWQGEVGLVTPRGIALELHDRIPGGALDGADVEGVLARARTVAWQGRELRIPSAADLAAGACLHVFDHHGGEAKFASRHLADLAVVVGAGVVGWDEVAARVPPGTRSFALEASRDLLDRGPPGPLRAAGHSLRMRAGTWAQVFSGDGSFKASAFRVLFPARAYMALRYGVSSESRLIPLLYFWRPIRGAWGFLTGR
jgi:hypothetical protein